ncbi:Lipoprotein NlpI, contains TPR repeats [Burkholderia sp. D7]|nr:Lipoprotein NlpI, contains TPR repeats [Burkholderia sp. D7]
MVLRDQHRYFESIEAYTLALKVQPEDAALIEGRGRSYQEMGNWEEAISDYSKAIVLQPSDDLPRRLRGLAYDHQGDYRNAVVDFTVATRLVPNSARGYVLWARALAHSHHDEESIGVLSDAIRLMPTDISLRDERATLLEHRGDYSSAVQEYKAILKIDPTNLENRIFLADDETTLSEFQDAARDYEIASRVKPDQGTLLFGRAQLSFYTGDYQRADSDLERWQELYREGKIEASNREEYYVAIWRHIVALRLNSDDRTRLIKELTLLDTGRWPYPVLALYTGKAAAATLMSVVNGSDPQDRRSKLCEANTYVGEWQLGQGDAIGAKQSFETASKDCPVDFVEKTLARRELERIVSGTDR